MKPYSNIDCLLNDRDIDCQYLTEKLLELIKMDDKIDDIEKAYYEEIICNLNRVKSEV